MHKPDPMDVRRTYGWIAPDQPEDPWHAYTTRVLSTELDQSLEANGDSRILNVGCGGFHYGLSDVHRICLDVTSVGLRRCSIPVEANAESLPFQNAAYKAVVCIGSVLNYMDASRCISEFARVTETGGTVILEFERSEGATYIGREGYCQRVWPVRTQYKGHEHRFWIYSEALVRRLLMENDLEIIRVRHFHIASALALRMTSSFGLSWWLSTFDQWLGFKGWATRHAANVLFVCRKR